MKRLPTWQDSVFSLLSAHNFLALVSAVHNLPLGPLSLSDILNRTEENTGVLLV